MFKVIHDSPQTVWTQLKDSETAYYGGFMGLDDSAPVEGVQMMPLATGAGCTTGKDMPLGICIGSNIRTPLFDTTGKCEYIQDATPHDSTTEYVSVGGMYSGGTREALVKLALIDPTTVIQGPIFNAAVGTAPSLLTTTNTSTTGTGCTTNANDVASVAVHSTAYFRSGANMGSYRVVDSAHATTHTWDKPLYKDIAIGDTLVIINGLRIFGNSLMQLGTTYCSYINCGAALTTDYYNIFVLRLDLTTAGSETVDFRWGGDNFAVKRT